MTAILRHSRSVAQALGRRLRDEIAHALSGSIVLQIGAGIAGFIMLSLAARAMSPAEFGHLAIWLSITQMGGVLAMAGQEMFVLRSLNEYMVGNTPNLARGALDFSFAIIGTFPVLVGLVLFLIGHFALRESVGLMVAAALYLIANAYIGFGGHLARYAVGMLMAEGTRELFWKSLTALALLLLLQSRGTINATEFLFMACVAMAVSLLLQMMAVARAFPREILKAAPEYRTREWLRSSSRFWVTTVLETLNQYFDVVVIYLLLDAPAAGVYFVATRIANAFGTLLAAAHVLATRRIPQLHFSGKTDEINRTFAKMAEVILLCVVLGMAVVFFGAELMLAFFGPAFVDAQWTLIVLVAGTAIYAAGGPAPAVLMITGHEGKYPVVLAANIVVRLAGFAALIPFFGLMGAAAAATGSLLLTALALNMLCRRWTGIDPSILGIFNVTRSSPKAGRIDHGTVNPGQPASRM